MSQTQRFPLPPVQTWYEYKYASSHIINTKIFFLRYQPRKILLRTSQINYKDHPFLSWFIRNTRRIIWTKNLVELLVDRGNETTTKTRCTIDTFRSRGMSHKYFAWIDVMHIETFMHDSSWMFGIRQQIIINIRTWHQIWVQYRHIGRHVYKGTITPTEYQLSRTLIGWFLVINIDAIQWMIVLGKSADEFHTSFWISVIAFFSILRDIMHAHRCMKWIRPFEQWIFYVFRHPLPITGTDMCVCMYCSRLYNAKSRD